MEGLAAHDDAPRSAGAAAYDEVPYPELSYRFTHPGRIAALAALLGRDVADPASARVLEIGTATGANLLPMAQGLPSASFVGIDYAPEQIAAARASALALGLANVGFEVMDLRDAGSLGQFDFVIAHGVASWVPPEVRAALWDVVAKVLAPDGIAFVSFNTYPGWRLLEGVRDMMRLATRGIEDPRERVRAAREIVRLVADSVPNPDESAWAAALRTYLDGRASMALASEAWADAALLHDELEDHNHPLLVTEAAEEAAAAGLAYFAEAELPEAIPHRLDAAVVEQLQQRATSRIDFEQLLDFVLHRTFRASLFVAEGTFVSTSLRPERMLDLSLTTNGALTGEQELVTEDARFRSRHPLTQAALGVLVDAAPTPVAMRDLLDTAAGPGAEEVDVQQCVVNLLQAHLHDIGLVDLWRSPPVVVTEPAERPVASPAARRLSAGRLVTNVLHQRVELDDDSAELLARLDGTRDLDALVAITGWPAARVVEVMGHLVQQALIVA